MLSAGICAAAGVLAASMVVHGRQEPALSDFSVAWVVLGVITLAAVPVCARLARTAGDDMSGRTV